MDKLIELRDIEAGYGDKRVLHDIRLDVWEKDFLGIIGPNGGGKTTLLKVILGLLPPFSGDIALFRKGEPVSSLRIGYLPQISMVDKKFPINVYDVIASGLSSEKPLFRDFNRVQKQRIDEVVEQMGLAELSRRPVAELSGGQFQRVLLGRAIVSRPDLLVLDEPNSYVDKRFASQFYKLLEQINQETAVVLVSHDVGTVLSLVKNIACVNETLHYHPGTDLTEEWLDQSYACPIDIVGHGHLPHRVLKSHHHNHGKDTE
ncbi:metal ABC transporter ATP-binding protein [Parabacteroides sp. OttesenSCG-928-N08]|nr:metal ABC transporter ATP-binding protein [Parabacteroides sp. OttesenSCG-928-N08]